MRRNLLLAFLGVILIGLMGCGTDSENGENEKVDVEGEPAQKKSLARADSTRLYTGKNPCAYQGGYLKLF